MERAEKEALVDDLKRSFGAAQSVVLTEFRGLTVEEATALRQSLRKQGVTFRVVKNTLAKRAIEGTGMDVVSTFLTGPTAWAFSDQDAVVTAKALVDFLKDRPVTGERLKIKAGYLSGRSLKPGDVEALAKLPGKDELRAQLLGLFKAPGSKLVRVLAARPSEFLSVLKARAEKLGEEAA